jgi:hypothetical protein
MTMSDQYTLHQGTQMYSFSYEMRTFQYSPEDVLQWCGQLGVGGHYFALSAAQHRGALDATNEFERFLKSAIARFGLTPSAYGSDYLPAAGQPTDDEKFEFTLMQLKSARKLGFPLMRIWWAGPGVMEKLLPYAEKYRIKLAYEIHPSMALGRGDPRTDQCIEYVQKKSSEYLGISPNGGSFATKIPSAGINYANLFGISPAIIQQAQRWFDDGVPKDKALAEAKKLDPPEEAAFTVNFFYAQAPAGDPNALRSLMPYVMGITGKFGEIKNGQVDDIPYENIVRILVEEKWPGVISTDYDGHLFLPPGKEVHAVPNIREFQEMIQRMANKYSSA